MSREVLTIIWLSCEHYFGIVTKNSCIGCKEMNNTFKDPVCKMVVSRLTAVATYDYKGKTYYFCAEICRDKFENNPEKYLSKWAKRKNG